MQAEKLPYGQKQTHNARQTGAEQILPFLQAAYAAQGNKIIFMQQVPKYLLPAGQ
jgi:ribosomal protein L4